MSHFRPLEVVGRGSETQLQVGEIEINELIYIGLIYIAAEMHCIMHFWCSYVLPSNPKLVNSKIVYNSST